MVHALSGAPGADASRCAISFGRGMRVLYSQTTDIIQLTTSQRRERNPLWALGLLCSTIELIMISLLSGCYHAMLTVVFFLLAATYLVPAMKEPGFLSMPYIPPLPAYAPTALFGEWFSVPVVHPHKDALLFQFFCPPTTTHTPKPLARNCHSNAPAAGEGTACPPTRPR